ncbi:efflux RND transporter permease subunit [Actinoplanes sp. NBRC 101535]|uniref:efflux RND transporter permease subunit n=1 Tax=Actinoplanes sp. NBRC 101535 TaxID=3032196 RepID=UPI0024A2B564|nr:efflux RND transporter permease subunit [Actinoplanes sp. NBRC 101535]GLY02621.1 hydrogenase expression protein [Actinoplanes sp. NBRC 101535]
MLSRISIANRKLVALIAVLIAGLGWYAATSLKQQLLPDLSFPAVTVVTSYPGAGPEVVEQQVTMPIEDAVANLSGVESMTSTSAQGSATVLLMFDYDTDIDDAAGEVEQAVSKLSARLPQDAEPQVLTGSTGDMPTMVLAATSDGSLPALATALNDKVVPALRGVDGVNDVSVSGTRDKIVSVTPESPATTQAIVAALGNLGGTSSAGAITNNGKDLSLAVGTSVTSLDQVKDLWVSTGSGKPAQLGDLADVTLTDAPATSITRTDGKPSLGVSLTMDHGGSSSTISDAVRDQLPDLETALGAGATLTVVADNGPSVRESVNGLLEEGALGLLMAVAVIVLFLRSARSTLVTAVSIPLSLLIALIVLWIQDYSLNILTLGGLTIAVGRVVDDSIVVLENIKRHLGYGEERRTAITTAVREVSSAVISSTLTTVAVFLPIAFVSGMVGELFGSFSITVTAAMLASLLVSLTVIPVLAYWFLKTPQDAAGVPADVYRERVEAEERQGLLQRLYLPVIAFAVRRRKTVLGAAALLLVATVAMATGLKTSFIDEGAQTSLSVTQTLPAGTDLTTTDTAAQKVEKEVAALDGVDSYQVVIGSSGNFLGGGGGGNTVNYTINLAEDADATTVQDDLRTRLDTLTGAGELAFGSGGGFSSSGIEVSVSADDDAALTAATTQITTALAGVTEVTDVTSDLSESAPQISIVTKGEAAARYGLTDQQIVGALRQAVQGATATRVTLDGTQHDVVVTTGATAPDSVADLKATTITTAAGPVELSEVATVTETDGPVQRTRSDGDRTNTVTATPVGDDTGAASTAVQAALDGVTLPAGASWEMGGVASQQDEAFSQLFLAIAVAIALVFLILVAVFRSIRQTLILLVSIPFAFVGAVFLLLVTGTPMGVAALIGILMLIGIVVTNAIVLVDLINQYRDRGMTVTEAVVEGGLRRLRPILMTALATIFALLPMALGITGAGGFISQPLAVVVIGGLLSSTVLTLVLIPVLYTMFTRSSGPAPAAPPQPAEKELVTIQ